MGTPFPLWASAAWLGIGLGLAAFAVVAWHPWTWGRGAFVVGLVWVLVFVVGPVRSLRGRITDR